MIDKLKQIRLHVTLAAVLCLILGVVFLFYPGTVTMFLARILAIILILVGATMLLGEWFNEKRSSTMLVAVLIAGIGVWFFTKPNNAASLIPIVIGVILVVNGIQDITFAFAGKVAKASRWGLIIFFGVLNIIAGVVAICYAFQVISIAMQLLGVMLIYDGISSMFIVHKVNSAERDVVDSTIQSEEDIDDYL